MVFETTSPLSASGRFISLWELFAQVGKAESVFVDEAARYLMRCIFDVSEDAQKMGFRIPVALSARVWNDCVAWVETEGNRQAMQDESSRLWDVLWRTLLATRKAQGDRYPLQLYRVPTGESALQLRLITLHVHIGPGDDGAPVITLLMPDEDSFFAPR